MKLDWLKAVKERPEDAAEVLSYFSEVRASARPCNEAMSNLRAAARVQTVEEADRACVDAMIKGLTFEEREALLDECKSARAREAEVES